MFPRKQYVSMHTAVMLAAAHDDDGRSSAACCKRCQSSSSGIPSTIGSLVKLECVMGHDDSAWCRSLQWASCTAYAALQSCTHGTHSRRCSAFPCRSLDLTLNQLTGPIPSTIGNLVNLQCVMGHDDSA